MMRREWSSLRFRGPKVKAPSVPKALSFLNLSSLSRQAKLRFPRYKQQLDPEDDFEEWVYDPFHQRAVSSLDEESKWSVHYTAPPWHQQENVFLPGSRPPCVEDLHHQAKVNLKTVLRECDKLRKDGFRSSQYYSQGPTFSSPILSTGSLDQEETEKKKKRSKVLDCLSESCYSLCCHLTPWRKKSSESSAEEEKLVYSMGSQTPLLDNICDINTQSSWSKSLPLPTPEEKMRQQAQSVATDIVPINITGENFDRQASFRRTLSNTDTVIRRSKKIKRRKTITGVPDNIQRELAGQNDSRTHSVYMPGQYSTLGHADSVNSPLKHSDTRESGCQTEEIKIVPPSMRRIRAQRGCGIAAQMANISLSSSGSISNMSDCNGAIFTPQRTSTDQGFHSLPRQGARISHQQYEPKYTSSPYKVVNGSTSSLTYQVSMQHASPSSHSRPNALVSPKSEEFQGFQNGRHNATPGYTMSSHNNGPAAFTPNGALQNLSDFSSIYSEQGLDTEETLQSVPSCPSDRPFSAAGTSVSAGSSRCQSPASFHTASHTETESQCSTLNGRNRNSPSGVRRDSDFSESSTHSCSTLTIDQWTYESAPKGPHTSSTSCSSPVSHVYNSLECSPTKTDSSSLFSVDTEGYYTSMHLDSGLKSHSHGCINKAGNARQNLYECREHHSQGDRVSLHSNQSLTRSISLRKAKKPPLPPKRTDSLRRKPQRKPHHSETVLNEQLITTLQESLKGNSASFSDQMPCNGFEDPWVLRPRSQSTASAASSGMSAPAAVCPVTPTHSDSSSSQRSEYAESWDFYLDFPRSQSEQGPSSPNARFASAGDGEVFTGVSADRRRMRLNIATSPDKVHHLTSPSSGYSSQSITPTAGTPVTSLLRAKSPAGRPKPKVPERKSSLRSSSVSSSTTSLSSNTSDSLKSLPTPPPLPTTLPGLITPQVALSISSPKVSPTPPPPPPPTTLPGLVTHQSALLASSMSNSVAGPKASLTPIPPPPPPPPPPLAMSSTPERKKSSTPQSPTKIEECTSSLNMFPGLPLPPSEVSGSLLVREISMEPPPSPPPPPPCVNKPPSPPPLPGMGLHAETILKTTHSRRTLELKGKEPSSGQPEGQQRRQKPLITPQALQLVQLRPIKLMKLENIFTDIITTVCSSANDEHFPELVETEAVENSIPDSPGSFDNVVNTSESEEDFTHYMRASQPHSARIEPVSDGGNVQELLLHSQAMSRPPVFSLQTSTASPEVIPSTPLKQKPPISPKKPGVSLIMPRIPQQSGLNEVGSPEAFAEPEGPSSTPLRDSLNLQEIPLQLDVEVESDSGNSTPVGPSRVSLTSEFSSESLNDPHFTSLIFNDNDLGLSDNDLGLSDDRGISDDGSSSSSGSISFKDDENEENDAVFNFSPDTTSPTSSTNEETGEEMVTPDRPRTTEDLFAAIHRSKRKVLGRGDSEEDRSRGSLSSPPVTPTGTCPGLPRQTGFIQRSLRRSTTSNDSFKALLLKKGSRSEHSFRMSAAEMLKFTDPRFQRPNGEASQTDALCTSPGRSRRACEEWARAEGALPRLSPGLVSSKYGRSSTPPSAASSRYNSRSRIPSGPMTVICEKEGELAESMDCCLGAELPFPMSLTSSGTVCAQGST